MMGKKTATVNRFTKYQVAKLVKDGWMQPETSTRIISDDCGAKKDCTEVDTRNAPNQVNNIAVTYRCAESGDGGVVIVLVKHAYSTRAKPSSISCPISSLTGEG